MLGGMAYSNSFSVPFQLDDLTAILDNPFIRTLRRPDYLFSYDPSRFLTHLSFAVNYHFGKWNVAGFHSVNLLLHCLNAFLVYLLLQSITGVMKQTKNISSDLQRIVPLFTALIFLTHPLQTGAVTYIVQRAVPLAVFFYCASLLLYLRLRQKFAWNVYAGFLFCLAAGTMTKPIFWTMPLAAALMEIYFLRNVLKQKVLLVWTPCLAVLVIVPVFLTLFVTNFLAEPFGPSKFFYATRVSLEIPRLTYLCTQFEVLILYLRLLVLPVEQNISYAFELSKGLLDPAAWFSFLGLLALLGFGILSYRRTPLISFAAVWFFILMIPESSVFPLPDLVFEHRMYLAVACFGMVVSTLISEKVPPVRARVYLSVIVVSFAVLTYSRNILWNDPVALMEDSIAKSPGKARHRNNLGILFDRGQMPHLAIREFEKASVLDPEFLPAYNNLGRIYAKQKKFELARKYFRQALEKQPNYFDANLNLAELYYRHGDLESAFAQFRRASDLRPQAFYPYLRLGDIYRHLKKFDEAGQAYQQAVRYNRGSLEARFALGNLYLDTGDFPQAIKVYQELLVMFPGFGGAHNTLGIAYAQSGFADQAEGYFKKALELDPEDPSVYLNLAQIAQGRGDLNRAEYYSNLARQFQSKKASKPLQK